MNWDAGFLCSSENHSAYLAMWRFCSVPVTLTTCVAKLQLFSYYSTCFTASNKLFCFSLLAFHQDFEFLMNRNYHVLFYTLISNRTRLTVAIQSKLIDLDVFLSKYF